MITFGERAFPVLRGNSDRDLIMAAAEYGTGRVFAAQNKHYFRDFTGRQQVYYSLFCIGNPYKIHNELWKTHDSNNSNVY